MRRLCIIAFAILISLDAAAAELQVGAAASLSEALQEIGRRFEREHRAAVRFNFAASSTIALQIREGAPIDVFISADEQQMDSVARGGFLLPSTRRDVLSNSLVIVVPRDSHLVVRSAADLQSPRINAIAIAEPSRVPAGVYAKQYLERRGLWPSIVRKVVPTDNVRATLAVVEAGNVDAGIVYRTDAAISHRVRIAAAIAGPAAPRIAYPAAVVRGSASPALARQFVNYLTSAQAQQTFARYGFVVR